MRNSFILLAICCIKSPRLYDRYIINGEIKEITEEFKNKIDVYNDEMAKDALRVLAFAYKEIDHEPSEDEMKNTWICVKF